MRTYSDRAISGASLLRPGLQGLIEDVIAGRLDVVVAEALDRLSRDQAVVTSTVMLVAVTSGKPKSLSGVLRRFAPANAS